MKNILSVLAVAAVLFSCSQKEFDDVVPCTETFVPEVEQFPQAWRLVKMTGSWTNTETTGEEMSWQELIELKADNTFIKTRKQDGKTKEGTGTFTFSADPNDNAVTLTLTYSSGKELIASCVSVTDAELYYFRTKCKMIGTWSMCDGPGLEYERQLAGVDDAGEEK